MDKVKDALHIGRSKKDKEDKAEALSNTNTHSGNDHESPHRDSYDSELEAMTPSERIAYLKEFEHAEKHGEAKKGGFLDRLISRGNKKTEDQLAEEARMRELEREKERAAQRGAEAGVGGGVN